MKEDVRFALIKKTHLHSSAALLHPTNYMLMQISKSAKLHVSNPVHLGM